MLQKSLIVIFLTIILLLAAAGQTAKADTVTYFISATIPAIPGFNVAPFDANSPRGQLTMYNDQGLDLFEEETFRNNQRVILKTLVPR